MLISIQSIILFIYASCSILVKGNDEVCKKYSQELSKFPCPTKPVESLVGDTNPQNGEFPHMAQIGYLEKNNEVNWVCAGTIISRKYVLTAAHCLFGSRGKKPRLIRVGITNEEDTSGSQVRNITELTVYPEYNKPSKYNDIALIKVDKEFDFTASVRPACLYTETSNPRDKIINTGWGPNGFQYNERKTILFKKYVYLDSYENCNKSYSNNIGPSLSQGIVEDKMICTMGNNEKDTCYHESGGPLQIVRKETEDIKCMYDIVGVSSFGKICGSNVPNVYTRVSYYTQWIGEIAWKDE